MSLMFGIFFNQIQKKELNDVLLCQAANNKMPKVAV